MSLEGRAAALEALAQGRGAVVWQRMIADVETPVSAALKLIEPGRGDWVLESVESGETRGRYSLLAGTSRDSIPEDMLLYAGGGGSIRGYAYQYAGELDEDDDPAGGVSAVDFSTELRFRINREYGFVLFGDGGGAFSSRNPSEKEEYFWGAGAGLRYFTPIGPIRLDVAVPLDRRSGVDDPFQLYLSLGQAF